MFFCNFFLLVVLCGYTASSDEIGLVVAVAAAAVGGRGKGQG